MLRMLRVLAGMAIPVFAFLVLFSPAWINGSPIYWYDSLAYLHGGSSALDTALGLDTRFSDMEKAVPVEPDAPRSVDQAGSSDLSSSVVTDPAEKDYRISMARSPYYSVIVVFLSDMGGPFAPIIAQVFLLMASGFFLLRAVFRGRITIPGVYLLAAISVSTAGVFCATLLPDILAPLCILSSAVLFCFYDRLGGLDKVFWFAVLVLSVISHTSHIAITGLLIPVGAVLALFRSDGRVVAPTLICLCAVIIGFLSLQVFSKTVEAIYNYKPRPFPMIAASVIVDGPGMAYLQATCPENGYVYCDYLYTEARNIDEFLWSNDRTKGVFHFETPEIRNRMSDQQFRFLIDVLKYDFGAQFQASFKRFFQQIQRNTLGHMAYDGGLQNALSDGLPNPDRHLMIESAAYSGAFPFVGISTLSQFFSLLALVGTSLVLARAVMAGGPGPAIVPAPSTEVMVSFVILLVLGIIVNAGITGVLSNPQGRYGARVLWLLLVMFAVVLAWYRCSPARKPAVATA